MRVPLIAVAPAFVVPALVAFLAGGADSPVPRASGDPLWSIVSGAVVLVAIVAVVIVLRRGRDTD